MNGNEFDTILKLLPSLQGPLAKYLQRDFNIFTAISDAYYKENLHSDILALILNPHTEKIGNITYLKTFLEYTDGLFHTDLKQYFQDENSVAVCREAGDTDILIHNGQYGIIIENKINKATDMPNQLCRYLNWAEQVKKLEVLQIFYIPFEKDKRPPIKDYDCGNKDYAFCEKCKYRQIPDDIRKRLNEITKVLNIKHLAEILEKCALKADSIEYKAEHYRTAKVFLEHYAKLILKTGGNMSDNKAWLLNEIFNEIKSKNISNEEMNSIAEIAEKWSSREATLRQMLADKLCNSKGYAKLKFDQRGFVYRKQIDEVRSIDYYPGWGTFGLAFTSEPDNKAIEDAKKVLNEAIRNAEVGEEYFSQGKDGAGCDKKQNGEFNKRTVDNKPCYWVHLNFIFANIKIQNIQIQNEDNPFDTILDNAVKCFTELEKLF